MKIEKSFELAHAPDDVWHKMGDVRLVADCLPGASITEDLGDDRYKGKFSVKLGPLAAAFAGEVAIERRADERTAIISGKGTDARSSSRASGRMTYSLTPGGDGKGTRVDVTSEIDLAGSLAQFSKGAIMQEVANRLTTQFVENFEHRLEEDGDAPASTPGNAPLPQAAAAPAREDTGKRNESIDAGAILIAVVKSRVKAFFRWLSGGGRSGR